MDIKRKLEIVETAILSISTHEDEDAALRNAALDRIAAMVERERAGIDERVRSRIEATLPKAPAAE